MVNGHTFRYFLAGSEIVRLAVIIYDRFPLSLCKVEALLREGSIHACSETVRFWWKRSGPLFASEIRNWRVAVDATKLRAMAPGRGLREDRRRTALPLERRPLRRLVTHERPIGSQRKGMKQNCAIARVLAGTMAKA